VTTTDAEVMQPACNLHDQIRNANSGQAQDIVDNPTPFDPSQHVFHHHACTRDEVIAEAIPDTQCLAPRLFLGWAVKTPAGS
jgi:hypothetical protein